MVERLSGLRIATATACVASLVTIQACTEGTGGGAAVVVRDSAGVEIVESGSPLHRLLTVDPSPLVEIADDFGEPHHYLYDVHHLTQFSDGRIVVGNSGTRELYYFDPEGTFLFSRGGPGEGPGELQRLFGLAGCDRDQVSVQELTRLSLFDWEGDLVRTVQVTGHLADRRASVVGLSADCESALLVVRTGGPPPAGETVFEVSFPMYWATFSDGARDTVGVISALDVQVRELNGQRGGSRRPFGREAVWSTEGDDLILGLAYGFEVHRIDRRGVLRQIIRWSAEVQPVSDGDWAYFVAQQDEARRLYPDEARFMIPVDEYIVPTYKPAYSRLVVDDQGRLWLQRYGLFGYFSPEPSSDWWVFDTSGAWLAEVAMPEGLQVLSIGNGRVIGVVSDSLDVQSVRAHALPEELHR